MAQLTGKKVAFLVSQKGIEEAELTQPWQAVRDAGGEPVLIAPEAGEVQAVQHDDEPAGRYPVDVTLGDASATDYAAVVIPGGTINADKLRLEERAVDFVQKAVSEQLVVAAICHGPWLLVEAGVADSRQLTSYPSLKTDISNAGGTWLDQEVVIDDQAGSVVVTSRRPRDLDAFSAALVEQVAAR